MGTHPKKADLKKTQERLRQLHVYLLDTLARAQARGVSSLMMPLDSLMAQSRVITETLVDLESHNE